METQTLTVPIKLANGKVIYAEATTLAGKAGKERDVASRRIDLEPQELSNIMQAIEGIASSVYSCLERVRPQEASVEFGLEIGVESGNLTALLVKASGKANLKITLKWSHGSEKAPSPGSKKAPSP